MARLTAPLLSLGASGSIAKALVFSSWKGIPYARVHVVPSNPQSVAQQEVRGCFSTLTNLWKRMGVQARLPFQNAVRGIAMTDRNKHIQENVAILIDDANLDQLVMSIAGGNAIVPINATAVDGTNGRIACFCEAPLAPPGYTISYMIGVAVRDGIPGDSITPTCYEASDATAPYAFDIFCLEDEDFQVALIARWIRDADQIGFVSEAVRFQVTVTGTP